MQPTIATAIAQLHRPSSQSHKGQNGRLLVIGGSELFHSSLIWAASAASVVVDMVHVASPAEVNHRLVRERIKGEFLDGIAVPWDRVEDYILEDDCVLIGPGMPRQEGLEPGEAPTATIVNYLLKKYPDKKWVIDGGALQEVDTALLNQQMIITPHHKEWERLLRSNPTMDPQRYSQTHHQVTILLKGPVDMVVQGEHKVDVAGGNEGMTKGGTGDVLAGLVAALFCTNEALVAAQVASYVNKQAGDSLYQRVGRFFTASDLVAEIPAKLFEIVR